MVSYCLNDKGVFFFAYFRQANSGESEASAKSESRSPPFRLCSPKRRKKITPVQPAKLILK